MAKNRIKAGHNLVEFDIAERPVAELAAEGAVAAKTSRER